MSQQQRTRQIGITRIIVMIIIIKDIECIVNKCEYNLAGVRDRKRQ